MKVPKHVAIILDGNRRYARKKGMPTRYGHQKGFDKIKDFLQWCIDLGIKESTLYCFSTENFNRSKKEVDYLFSLFKQKFDSFSNDNVIHKNEVKINVIGRISMFPKDMQKKMKDIMKKTKKYSKYQLNLALGYGGRAEIVDAIKKIIAKKVKKIDEKVVLDNLYLKDEPDLFIRPGGEKRISNFLIYQSAYCEMIFVDKLWPDFSKKDLVKCVEEFNMRKRRIGK